MGVLALGSNVDGDANVGVGDTAMGGNVSGSFNTMVGDQAGADLTSGADNIYIGATSGSGVTSEDGTIRIGDPTFVGACFIAGIFNRGVDLGTAQFVFADATGKIGTVPADAAGNNMAEPQEMPNQTRHNQKGIGDLEAPVRHKQQGM